MNDLTIRGLMLQLARTQELLRAPRTQLDAAGARAVAAREDAIISELHRRYKQRRYA